MGRTACTEPQCLYKGALYLLPFTLISQKCSNHLQTFKPKKVDKKQVHTEYIQILGAMLQQFIPPADMAPRLVLKNFNLNTDAMLEY
jgi:hypothetical protein